MGKAAAKRLLAVLTAVTFLIAAALPGTASVMPMPGATIAPAASGKPCDHCPPRAPASDIGGKKMPCSALACAGSAVALPTLRPLPAPAVAVTVFPAQPNAQPFGAGLEPSPYPPKRASVA